MVDDDQDWKRQGACRGEDPELFFLPDGMRGPAKMRQVAEAKAVCVFCPVRAQCLRYALARGEFGVWGGTDEDDRRKLRAETMQQRDDAGSDEPHEVTLDLVAVERAIAGEKRDRRLTNDERVEVVRRILADGGGYNRIMTALRCNYDTAKRLIAEVEQLAAPVAS